MKTFAAWLLAILVVSPLALAPAPAAAQEYDVTCASDNNRYTTCPLREPGYVTLEEQQSQSACVQGRSWDYDRREIWVDDGCRALFRVHPQGSDHVSGGEAAAAVGLVLGAAILGALAENDDHEDDRRYKDENYHGPRHSSYVPDWMVGRFRGYNPQYGVEVTMTIQEDGRLMARTDDGRPIPGWVNDHRLHVGDAIFDINRTRNGFATHPVGDHHNVLQYRRLGNE